MARQGIAGLTRGPLPIQRAAAIAARRGTGQNLGSMARQHHARAAHPRMTRLLVALLVLVALVASPAPAARAMPQTLAFDAALVICHAGTEDGAPSHGPAPVPSHDLDCKRCPACHIAAQPVLPVGDAGFVVTVLAAAPAHAAALPPATGPPRPLSPAAPPTGPPAASA